MWKRMRKMKLNFNIKYLSEESDRNIYLGSNIFILQRVGWSWIKTYHFADLKNWGSFWNLNSFLDADLCEKLRIGVNLELVGNLSY